MLIFRKLLAHEAGCLKDHLLRLDEEDRRLRFGHIVSPEVISAYVDTFDWAQTWVVGAFESNLLRGVAELRDHGTPGALAASRTGEIAVTVEPAFRKQGVGTRLLNSALLIARNRGFASLYLLCLPENLAMQRLARRFGEQLSFHDGDIEVHVRSPQPDPLSFLAELFEDSAALWRTALN